MSRIHVSIACVGIAAAGFLLFWSLNQAPPLDPVSALRRARLALAGAKYAQAEELALQVPKSHSGWTAAMLVAGEAATKDKRLADAAEYYRSIPLDDSKDYLRQKSI